MSEPKLFDYIGDITYDKKYIFDEELSKNYVPFMVNRGLAQHIDTVLLANEMNKRSTISKLMHHDFLFYAVDARKRYGKWAKATEENTEVVEYIQQKVSVNRATAIEYIRVLDSEELAELEKFVKQSKVTGGKK